VENSKVVVFTIGCCHGNSLQYTPMNENETPCSCVANIQGLKPKDETNRSFLVLHPSSGEDTVNTVGSHLKG